MPNMEICKSCIFKGLKLVHHDIGISSKAMEVMNNFIIDICEKLTQEALHLVLVVHKQGQQ